MGLIAAIAAAFLTGRMIRMYRQTSSMLRGIGVGLAVGVATAVIANKALHDNRGLRHSAHKAARAVTGLMEDVGQTVTHNVAARM